jgi:hypothetical protein
MKFWVTILASLIVGAILGWLTAIYFTGAFLGYADYTQRLANATVKLAALNELRAGQDPVAIKILEQSLDENVIELGTGFPDAPKSSQAQVLSLFERIRTYRQAHDVRNAAPPVEAVVSEMLDRTRAARE